MYVVFEGADGAGKSTATRRVAELLAKELPDRKIDQINEPFSSSNLGQVARGYLFGGAGRGEPDPYVAALLMVAARIDLHSSVDWTKTILSDRSFLTTYVYQEEVGRNVLDRLHGFTFSDPWEKVRKPDLVFYLEVSAETAVRRVRERGHEHFTKDQIYVFVDAYDREVEGWNRHHPHQQLQVVTIDAERPVDEVASAIFQVICSELGSPSLTTDHRPLTPEVR